MFYRRNSDENLRRWERAASTGDLFAQKQYVKESYRVGRGEEALISLIGPLLIDNSIDQAMQLLALAPSYGDQHRISREACYQAVNITGIWHGLLILTQEDFDYYQNAINNDFWGARTDYPAEWSIHNIRENIDLTQALYTYHNNPSVYVELNLGMGPLSLTVDGHEWDWELGNHNLLGTHVIYEDDNNELGEMQDIEIYPLNKILLHIGILESLL
jgi:hypothetical protein